MNLLINFHEKEPYYSVIASNALLRHKAKFIYGVIKKLRKRAKIRNRYDQAPYLPWQYMFCWLKCD